MSAAGNVQPADTVVVPVFKDRYAKGWPEHRADDTTAYMSIGHALFVRYVTDAHFAAYSVPTVARRLASENVFAALPDGIPMTLFVIDLDSAGHKATKEWLDAARVKIDRLLVDHPGGFVYRTKNGYRIVYRLATPFVLFSAADAARWTRTYLGWLAYLLEQYDITGDPACKDWTHFYRLPKVRRDGQHQKFPTFGDPYAIGAWALDFAAEAPPPPAHRTPPPTTTYRPRAGDFALVDFMATHYPGTDASHVAGGRRWDIECPWQHEHTTKSGKRETSVFERADGRAGFKCQHTHCADRGWRDLRKRHEPDWVPFAERTFREPPPEAQDDDDRDWTGPMDATPDTDTADHYDDVPPPTDADAGSRGDDADVRARLFTNKEGKPKACGSNIELILRESTELRGRIRFNIITRTVEVTGGRFQHEQANGLDIAIKNWLETEWFLFVDPGAVGKQLLRVARQFGSYDPVKEYLDDLVWDGVARIDTWLRDYCNVVHSPYVQKIGARFLISAAARGLDPGCKVDTVLILKGPQGYRKSSAFDVLGGEWFTDSPLDLSNKDARITAASRWLVELAELSSIRQSGLESHKAFLAARKDYVRPPYGTVNEEFLRHCVFSGSTNADEFLIDETGNRRFWVATVTARINIDALRRDRDMLWAEAVVRYRDGERWWFEGDEQVEADKVASEHTEEDPWADAIADWFAEVSPSTRTNARTRGLSLADVASQVLDLDLGELKRHERALGKAMRSAGFAKRQAGGERVRRWFPPEHDGGLRA